MSRSADVLAHEALFLAQLDTIERVIAFTCGRSGYQGADAEDFGSFVKLKLIEKDYAIVGKFEARCSFATYISVVIQRLLLDYRVALWGKWHASAEAKRLGEPAVTIEAMVVRDGFSLDDALPALRRRWPELTREQVEDVVTRLPRRMPRPRVVALELVEDLPGERADDLPFENERVELGRMIAGVIRRSMEDCSEEDRLVCRLRFEAGMSIADISRLLGIEQKPLYRRLDRLLRELRQKLSEAGVDEWVVRDVLSSRAVDLDFGFGSGTPSPRPSNHETGREEGEGP
jgi:RNA polymerase sigma factor (sigma-70 family)